MATPYALVSLDRITSTQDEARSLIGAYPTVVVAAEQTAGRGRSGAAWENAPVALAVSVAFRPSWPSDTWARLALVAGVAAARTLGSGVGLKWPNDVVRDGMKIGGILSEAAAQVVTIGLGVNLWWPEAPDGLGALFEDPPSDATRIDLATRWAEEVLALAVRRPEAWPRGEYLSRCVTVGQTISWDPDGAGTAVDVDESGALVVDVAGKRQVLTSAAVQTIRQAL